MKKQTIMPIILLSLLFIIPIVSATDCWILEYQAPSIIGSIPCGADWQCAIFLGSSCNITSGYCSPATYSINLTSCNFTVDNSHPLQDVAFTHNELYYYANNSGSVPLKLFNGSNMTILLDDTIRKISNTVAGSKDGTTVSLVTVSCQDLSRYNDLYQTSVTSANVVLSQRLIRNSTQDVMSYVVTARDDRPVVYTYLFTLNPKEMLQYTELYAGLNDLELSNYPCRVSATLPGKVNDGFNLQSVLDQLEQNQANDIKDTTKNIWDFVSNITNMLYEVLLWIYWLIKIMLFVFVISTIFWLFLWLFTIIKKFMMGGRR